MSEDYLWTIKSRDETDATVAPDMDTIPKCMVKGLTRFEPLRTFGTRSFLPDNTRGEFEWYSYGDLFQMVNEIMAGFHSLNISHEKDVVGIMAQNRIEWAVTDYACMCAGINAVPIYDNQGLPEIEYILNHAEVSVLVISIDCLTKISKIGLDKLPLVKRIILMDERLDDRVWVQRFLEDKVPAFASTVLKSNEVMDMALEQYKTAFETQKEKDPSLKDGVKIPRLDAEENKADWEQRKNEAGASKDVTELDVDACVYLHAYAPPAFINHRFIDGDGARSDNEDLADMVTDTFMGVREAGFRLVGPATDTLHYSRLNEIKTDDLATVIYTSGTTGNPKGACLSHGNLIWGAAALTHRGGLTEHEYIWPFVPFDYYISYLPYGHVFARTLGVRVLTVCEHNGFYQGDTRVLMDDIKTLRPTILPMVPRICQKIYDSVMQKMSHGGFVKKTLFNRAMAVKRRRFYGKGKWNAGVYDRLVFSKLSSLVGDRVRIMYSGSAPLPKNVGEFIQLSLCPNLIEGYGATETSCQGLLQHHHLRRMGDLGFPSPAHEAKLEPVLHYNPQADIAAGRPPRGQLLIRGPAVFKGYFKNDEATKKALTPDGWYRTGDVAEFIEKKDADCMESYARVIDRVRNVFKLSQGEFVCSDAVTNVVNQTTGVGSFFLYGNGQRAYVMGVVVPDASSFAERAEKVAPTKQKKEELDEELLRKYCSNTDVIADMLKQVHAKTRELGLRGFEIPRAIVLDPVAWTEDNGLLTPSMKPRTPELKKRYKATFERLYEMMEGAGLDTGRNVDFAGIAKLAAKAVQEVPFGSIIDEE